jgi:tRNA wybutosine-synthesizing protein 1
VRAFAKEVQEYMPDHDVLKEVPASRVSLLSKTDDTWVPKLRKDSDFWARDPVVGD